MNVLVADPRTADVVGSGALGRGHFKTTAGAGVWAPIPLADVVSALAIDPVNPAIIYAGACCRSQIVPADRCNGAADDSLSHDPAYRVHASVDGRRRAVLTSSSWPRSTRARWSAAR